MSLYSRYFLHEKHHLNIISSRRAIEPEGHKRSSEMMKGDQSVIEGENVSDVSSSLSLRVSNENCGGSDLTAERMAERSSRSSSNLDHGSVVKLDAATLTGINTADISVGKYKASQDFKPWLTPAANKYNRNNLHSQHTSPVSDPKDFFQRERIEGRAMGSRILMDRKPSIVSEKDADMEGWLELGLGSAHRGSKRPQDIKQSEANSRSSEYCARPWKEPNRRPPSLSSLTDKEGEKYMHPSFSNTQMYRYLPLRYSENSSDKDIVSLISSSCERSYLEKSTLLFSSPEAKFSAQNDLVAQREERNDRENRSGGGFLYQNSEQPAVLQDAINIFRIQPRRPWSGNGDFTKPKSINFGPFVRPIDISPETKLLSGGLTGRTQCHRPQYAQSFMMAEPIRNEASIQFGGVRPFSSIMQTEKREIYKHRRPDAGLWFMLQVAPTQDRDRLLPQIAKTYLRIKDGTTTIQTVKKYLASKLGLKSESEIEITCKGQQLLSFFTLQRVRDEIWFSSSRRDGEREADGGKTEIPHGSTSLLSKYSCREYLMILNYLRSTGGN